MLHCDIVTVF